MHKAKIDVPVLILFFNRPALLEKVFDAVKRARPSKLYLFQDGARAGRPDDVENIQKIFGVLLLATGLREVFYRPRKAK